MPLPDGSVWKNVTTPAKSKVAETLAEFRGNYAYNLMDEHVRRFNAEVPMFAQWDDHEVTNNWYPGEDLAGDPTKAAYKVTSVDLLAARAAQAFFDYLPIRAPSARAGARLRAPSATAHRSTCSGSTCAAIAGPTPTNDQPAARPGHRVPRRRADPLAEAGAARLRRDLEGDRLRHADRPDRAATASRFENGANGDGPARGRELEIAGLLRFIRDNEIRNVVWLTADVHYTAAHHYDPNRAQFQEFAPFWEFVSGPLNAGTFGPGKLDNTFGPKVVFHKAPARGPGQPAAVRRPAVLRPGRHRRRQRGHDRAAQGPDRRHPVHPGARARDVIGRSPCLGGRTPPPTVRDGGLGCLARARFSP